MKTILVTGSDGFIGRNLQLELELREDVRVLCFDVHDDPENLQDKLLQADLVYHLAGVNRPQKFEEFRIGNLELTAKICHILSDARKRTPLLITSSTQAALENAYGKSKREAEKEVFQYSHRTGAPVYVYRLANVFGKWSRPNYNSVVSTFCFNISHGLDITISDPASIVELIYIDDIIASFIGVLDGAVAPSDTYLKIEPAYSITLGELAKNIYSFRDIRSSLLLPNLADDFIRKLHATYLSYLAPNDFSYPLDIKSDNRGELAEIFKSAYFGQMFVSRTHPGVVRGNHYHNTKIEKFCVLQGEGVIRFRHLISDEVIEYQVSGAKWEVVDIPPGYTHNIENSGTGDLITLFWANQIFDRAVPDTHYSEVKREQG